jgi:hypothetical protein
VHSPRRLVLGVAVGALLAASSCAVPVHRRTIQSAQPVPVTTLTSARKILTAYQDAKAKADRQRSVTLLGKYETGSTLAIDSARYKIDAQLHAATTGRSTFEAPRFYIPRLAAYPHWFVVQAARSGDPDHKAVYMVFERARVVSDWKLAMAPTTYKGARRPELSLDPDGYAMTVPATAPLAFPPGKLPAAHADVLSRGKKSEMSSRLSVDPFTTQLRKQDSDQIQRLKGTATAVLRHQPLKATLVCALKTTEGALVIYSTMSTAQFSALPLSRIVANDQIEALGGKSGYFKYAASTRDEQFVAAVPRSGKVIVLGHEGNMTTVDLR